MLAFARFSLVQTGTPERDSGSRRGMSLKSGGEGDHWRMIVTLAPNEYEPSTKVRAFPWTAARRLRLRLRNFVPPRPIQQHRRTGNISGPSLQASVSGQRLPAPLHSV